MNYHGRGDAAQARFERAARFSPEQTAAAAVKAGWPAVEIWVDPACWTAAIAAQVRTRTADAGVVRADVEAVQLKPGFDDPDHFRIIDAGAEIAARNGWQSAPTPIPQKRKPNCSICRARGDQQMRVSLEFVAFAEVPSVAAALAILDNPGCEDIGLLIDPLHFARMGSSPRDLEGVEYGRPHYAQFCDAAAQGPSVEDVSAIVEEALERRLSICAGALPLGALLRQNPAKLPLSIDCARNRCARAGPIRPTAPARFSN